MDRVLSEYTVCHIEYSANHVYSLHRRVPLSHILSSRVPGGFLVLKRLSIFTFYLVKHICGNSSETQKAFFLQRGSESQNTEF